MNVWINLTLVHRNQRVSILLARTGVTAYRAGEIKVLIAAATLTNVLKDLTTVHTTRGAPTPEDHTDVTAYQVGETKVIIRVSTLMNVPKDGTAALPTPTALTCKAHIDATATAVFTNLEAVVIMIVAKRLVTITSLVILLTQLITRQAAVISDGPDAEDQGIKQGQNKCVQVVKYGLPTELGPVVRAHRCKLAFSDQIP